jgi:alpha-beta hydrolase superfamily lysophospholipase
VENDMVLGANIFLMGKSFGGAVASYLISQLNSKEGIPANIFFKGLILESTFTSLTDVIKEKAGGWIPKTLISDNTWPTIDRLSPSAVKVKTLIMHGTNDTLVRVEHANALKCKLPEAELVLIPGADHN